MNLPRARAQDAGRLLRDGEAAARAAHVRYVSDSARGITRVARGGGFIYHFEGRRVTNAAELARIRALAIPPAWKNVWICASSHGHLQATGRDARGRKQYRYHAAWRTIRDLAKYQDLVAFGHALPALRRQLASDLRREALDKNKVVAAVVALMQQTAIRVGNDRYAQDNGSYGLTTLLNRHASISGARFEFRFRGKGGKVHQVRGTDRRLAAVVERCRELPGQRLFQYLDARGRPHAISSSDVNEYLRRATGKSFTAKEFRTWRGTVSAALYLTEQPEHASTRAKKQALARAIEHVAGQLGNTIAICRKCYVHPAVLDAHLSGELSRALRKELRLARHHAGTGLSRAERAVLHWLEKVVVPASPARALARVA